MKRKELEEKIVKLESIVDNLQNPVIGEVWGLWALDYYDSRAVEDGADEGYFYPFTQKDIKDTVNGHIKIQNVWFSVNDVVFYNHVYNKQKDIIEKRKAKKIQ